MTELEPYQPRTEVARPGADTDSWTGVIAEVADLASKIANTEFVPESLRGRTAAVAAAILAGREMGVPPMAALQGINVIKGKPGQSAQLMRQLVLAAGHSIRYVETTDTRCVVEGRRRGEEDWERVTFTADQARKAKIDLGGYPEDKLVARATSRLCRRKFADAIGGMAYTVEELEDGAVEDGTVPEPEPPAATKRRTAQRKTSAKKDDDAGGEQSVRAVGRQQAQAAPKATVPEPPLPGEEITVDETSGGDPVTATVAEPDDDMVTKAQLTKMAAAFGELDVKDRDTRVRYASVIVGRPLDTSKELTRKEASTLIDTLGHVAASEDPAVHLAALVETVANVEVVDHQTEDQAARDEAAAEAQQ